MSAEVRIQNPGHQFSLQVVVEKYAKEDGELGDARCVSGDVLPIPVLSPHGSLLAWK